MTGPQKSSQLQQQLAKPMPVTFEQHVRESLQQGYVKKLTYQDSDSAVGYLPNVDDDYIVLFDTASGHAVRVPEHDRRYMLAKQRPLKKGERTDWYKNPVGPGVIQSAPSGSVPAYSEVPVVVSNHTKQVATTGEVKAPARRRRRGARGARRSRNGSTAN